MKPKKDLSDEAVLRYVLQNVAMGDYQLAGGEITMDCPHPRHRDPRTLYVEPHRYLYHCFSCGLSGSFRWLVLDDPPLWSPVRRACERGPGVTNRSVPEIGNGLMPLIGPTPGVSDFWRKQVVDYLLGRGVTPSQIELYRLSVRPFDNRVWIPWWRDRKVVYAVGRLIDGDGPKTLEESEIEKPLFGLHVRPVPPLLLLVEGFFDHAVTVDSACLMGSQIGPFQVEEIDRLCRSGELERVAVLCDPDAKEKARQIAHVLRRRGIAASAAGWSGTSLDPNELGPVTMMQVRNSLREMSVAKFRAVPCLALDVRRPDRGWPWPATLRPPSPSGGEWRATP